MILVLFQRILWVSVSMWVKSVAVGSASRAAEAILSVLVHAEIVYWLKPGHLAYIASIKTYHLNLASSMLEL